MSPADDKTVLIIEDDPNTSALVALYLEREGFKAVKASDGEAGLLAADRHRPVLVVLDLMLPRMDGWEVCRRLRRRAEVPVIMLTARGEEIDRVSGLTLGADDYVVKPFSPRELVARVKAVLRRAGGPVAGAPVAGVRRLVYENILLDLDRHQLSVDGLPVPLTPHEFSLLETLMAAPGRAFSRDALLSTLYPHGEAMVIDRVVDVHIGKLRQKIEPKPSEPRRIITVRGIGYRFADPVPGLSETPS